MDPTTGKGRNARSENTRLAASRPHHATIDQPGDLTAKRAGRVICPACKHNDKSVVAKVWVDIAAWRRAAMVAVCVAFAPVTLGAMLFALPAILEPHFAVHSCPRCGLRLAISTVGPGEFRYTIPFDDQENSLATVPDDWRPDLARMPAGLRVARSPLGLPSAPSLSELHEGKNKYRDMRAQKGLKMIPETRTKPSFYSAVYPGESPDDHKGGRAALYEVVLEGRREGECPWGTGSGIVKVMMKRPPPYPGDKGPSSTFVECTSIKLSPGRPYECCFTFPSGKADGTETAHTSVARARAQFYPGKLVWQWRSTQGMLLWVERQFQDADMSRSEWRLCLVDAYERLLAVVIPDERERLVNLYADLGAGLVGEVLGSLCALYIRSHRAGAEIAQEQRQKKRDLAQ